MNHFGFKVHRGSLKDEFEKMSNQNSFKQQTINP